MLLLSVKSRPYIYIYPEYRTKWKKISGGSVVFSMYTPVSFTNKTDRHDITEIFLKVALNTIILLLQQKCIQQFAPATVQIQPVQDKCFTHISLGEIPVLISLENLSISRAFTLYDHVLSLTCYLFQSSTTHGCVYKQNNQCYIQTL